MGNTIVMENFLALLEYLWEGQLPSDCTLTASQPFLWAPVKPTSKTITGYRRQRAPFV
jgi:hypothetical protein